MQYNLKEQLTTETDPKDAVIEKHGDVHEFTIRKFEDNIRLMEKTIKELEAKYDYDFARKENIEHFHPFVLNLTEEQLLTCHMYAEACSGVRIYGPKLEEFKAAMETEKAEIEEVYKQIPELKIEETVQESESNE